MLEISCGLIVLVDSQGYASVKMHQIFKVAERVKGEGDLEAESPSYPQGNSEKISFFVWEGYGRLETGWTECQITIVRGGEITSANKDHSTVISPSPCEPCTHPSCLEGFPLPSHIHHFL